MTGERSTANISIPSRASGRAVVPVPHARSQADATCGRIRPSTHRRAASIGDRKDEKSWSAKSSTSLGRRTGSAPAGPALPAGRDRPGADRLRSHQERLTEILELGLRELNAGGQSGFEGAAEVLEFLAGLPSPEEILALRPSDRLRGRVQELLEKNRQAKLTPEEEEEWERYEYLEHLVRMAKASACLKLGMAPADA